jgi:hypothetical protein
MCYSVQELTLCPYFADIPFVCFSDYTLLILIINSTEIIESSCKYIDLCPRGVRFECRPEFRGFLEFYHCVQKNFRKLCSVLQNITLTVFIKIPL